MMSTQERATTRPRWRQRRSLLVFAIVAVLAVPTIALAHDTFSDVSNGNVHHDNINAIADVGVTLGCGAGEYCPNDFVTRAQMGSFMARGLGLGSNGPVANAAHALDVANGAITNSKLAGPLRSRWATVQHDGTLVRGRNATDANKVGNSAFSYEVSFDRNVSQCAYAASLTEITGGDSLGFVETRPMAGNANAVNVITRDHDAIGAARSFHLTVSC